MAGRDFEISLDAVIVAVTDDSPRLLTVDGPDGLPALPSGILEPHDVTLERGVRRWVQEQTGLDLGYVEQLYTFGDRARGPGVAAAVDDGARHLSIAYLALVREDRPSPGASWVDVYDLFPWEDHRRGRPEVLTTRIDPVLDAYVAARPEADGERRQRDERVRIVFGGTGPEARFDGARPLERYELLYEVGLVAESGAAGGDLVPSKTMTLDHRRITATALTRIRGKLGYRPLVFELLPSRFTLLALQRVVEALAGVPLHKQNFRRLVEGAGLVERTGEQARTGGRPAELFRFRREVLGERPRPGVGTPWVRS
ncbi:MAG: NUDIX domain-containing protein [Actinomycetota bacterium]